MSTSETLQGRPPVALMIKVVLGGFLTLLGLLLTADNFGLINSDPITDYWSLVLVAIGVIVFAGGGSRLFALGLVVAGLWILALNLGFILYDIFDVWPLLLIAAGLVLIVRGIRPATPAAPKSVPTNQTRVWSVLSSRKVRSASPDFSGGYAYAFMGGSEIDLTAAKISRSPAVIDVGAFWGSIEIVVPYDWEVVGEVTPVMAGFDDTTRGGRESGQQLVVRGFAMMAGIEVKRRKEAHDD
jgi:predicted membrane protein